MSVVVIIPAAGSGSRFGGSIPKQFQQLAGKPVLQHVIERFLYDSNVIRVIVPVAPSLLDTVKNTDRVKFIAGGATRQESVMRGVEAAGDDAQLIAIHDAARPLFSIDTLHAVMSAARDAGAALPVIPVTDTIHVMTNEATIDSTLERSMLGAAQTPQCFRPDILRDVLERAARDGVTAATDEAGLAARYGYLVKAVPGDPRNLKITLPEDLAIAESYLEQWEES